VESKAAAMFRKHAKPRGVVKKFPSDGEGIFVTDGALGNLHYGFSSQIKRDVAIMQHP
jgi:hypothetical protein